MTTAALTLNEQALSLQTDLKTALEAFFEQLPELSSITAQSAVLVTQAKALSVRNNDPDDTNYINAADSCKALKAVNDQFDALITPYVEKAHKLHKTLTGIRTSYMQPADQERTRLNGERSAWYSEQERIRREAAQREAEEARQREEARLLEEARQLEAQGDKQAAEEVFEEAVNVVAPVIVLPSTVPQIQGTSFRSVWKWELKDKSKLKPEFIIADEKGIGATVRAMHNTAEMICGTGAIRVFEEKIPIDK